MPRRRRQYEYETSLTATLNRQWDYLADSIIMKHAHLSDEAIADLIRKENGCKSAEWIRARRPLLHKPKVTG